MKSRLQATEILKRDKSVLIPLLDHGISAHIDILRIINKKNNDSSII